MKIKDDNNEITTGFSIFRGFLGFMIVVWLFNDTLVSTYEKLVDAHHKEYRCEVKNG